MENSHRRSSSRTAPVPSRAVAALAALILAITTLTPIRAEAQPGDLGLHLDHDQLTWNQVRGADAYIVSRGRAHETRISATAISASDYIAHDFLDVSVSAVDENNVILGVERLRTNIAEEGPEPRRRRELTVGEGLDALATIAITTRPKSVTFRMPRQVLRQIDSWELYRDGVLVETSSARSVRDSSPTPGASHAYTVVLNAPNWTSAPDDLEWVRAECTDGCDTDTLPADTEAMFDDVPQTADGMSFTMPVEIPVLGRRATRPRLGSSTADDASVWHNTFIPMQYVNAPEPPTDPDYWYGGDNRGFASGPGSSVRTQVKTITDFEDNVVTFTKKIQATHRYVRNSNGTYTLNASQTGQNNPTVEYIANDNNSGRPRVRVRHSAGNTFQNYFPNIDYEWEYTMVSDGGVSARGLHDGAPNYETFYEPPFSSAPVRVYTFTYTSFNALGWPMDQKNRSWCRPAGGASTQCPGFGTARWV